MMVNEKQYKCIFLTMIMENKTDYICPICIDTKTEYKTECGHKYCLSKIKKCALCRKNLLNTNIYSNANKKNSIQ